MEFEPMLTPREKSPLPKMSPEEDRTRDAVDSEPKHYQLSYSGPLVVNKRVKRTTPGCAAFWAKIAITRGVTSGRWKEVKPLMSATYSFVSVPLCKTLIG